MYEIRKYRNMFRVYDKKQNVYVGYTTSENVARRMVSDYLSNRGFEGEIPTFFLRGGEKKNKYGINLDSMVTIS